MEEGAQRGTANIINRTFGHKSFFNVFLKFFITDLRKELRLLVRHADDTKLEERLMYRRVWLLDRLENGQRNLKKFNISKC